MELEFRSRKNRRWKIIFYHYKKVWGPTYPKPLLAVDPISLKSSGSEDLSTTVRGCTGNIRFVVDGESITRERFNDFFSTGDIRDLRFELWHNITPGDEDNFYSVPLFQGFVRPEAAEQPLQPYPYEVELPIVDSLAAAEYIRPENFMERCAATGYRFSMKELLEWWREDLDVNTARVIANRTIGIDTVLEKPLLYASDYMEITENVGATPYNDIKPKSYKELFDKILGTTHMFFSFSKIIIHRRMHDYDLVTRWKMWTFSEGQLLPLSGTEDLNPESLENDFYFNGKEHTMLRLPERTTFYSTRRRKEDVQLDIDFDKNTQIRGEQTEDGYLWGQGNLRSYGEVSMQKGNNVNVDPSSMTVTIDTLGDRIYISPGNGEKVLTLETVKPVAFAAVDRMMLTGRLVQTKKTVEGSWTNYQTVNDYDNALKFSIQWGKYYCNGGAPGINSWGTIENKLDMKMAKNYNGGDTSNFYDFKTDPLRNEETAFSKILNCQDYHVANYEGFHILATPPADTGCEKIKIHIYASNTAATNITGLSLKSYNDDVVEHVEGDSVDGEEIEYMPDGENATSIWDSRGEAASTLLKFDAMGAYHPQSVCNPFSGLISFDGEYHQLTGYSFNPYDETGSMVLGPLF